MDPVGIEMFPTKGIEYLLVIAYLAVLVVFWQMLSRADAKSVQGSFARDRNRKPNRWFDLPEGVYYHPGHSWAVPAGGHVVRIGVDDFAQKLVGKAAALNLPEVGEQLVQGQPGCSLQVDGEAFGLLSPIDGAVVARNEALLDDPSPLNDDPYGAGWLLEIEARNLEPNLKTLLSGDLARAWMRTSEDALFGLMPRQLGVVMQDGGVPVTGIARAISPREWADISKRFLLTR